MKRLIDEAIRLLKTPSISLNGNEEVSNLILSMLQDRGLKVQLQQVAHSIEEISKRQFNVIGVLGDPLVDRKTKRGLLLLSHLDTATAGNPKNWTELNGAPLSPETREGKIFGLGAVSGKLDFLAKLYAMERFRDKKLKQPVYLVGSCGAELGMFGARYLIKSLSLNPKYVMVGAPTDLKLVYAHKSSLSLKVSIGYQNVERDARGFNRRIDLYSSGVCGSPAFPLHGVNAITQAFDFLQAAVDYGFELRFTNLKGGEIINKVPDEAKIEFYLTSHQLEDFKRFIKEYVKSEEKEAAFKLELGGLGDAGVKFLPEHSFPIIQDIQKFFVEIEKDFHLKLDNDIEPPCSTYCLTRISQGPGSISMCYDFHLNPNADPNEIEKLIQQGVANLAVDYPALNISVVRERLIPALNMSPANEFVKTCQSALEAAGLKSGLAKRSQSTEAALFFQSGFEVLAFGPGYAEANLLAPNEHNLADHLELATDYYEKLIQKICL